MRKLSLAVALLSFVLGTPIHAVNITIDFNDLPAPPAGTGTPAIGLNQVAVPYTEDGFSLTTNNVGTGAIEFYSVHSESTAYVPGSIVSVTLKDPSDNIILTQSSGDPFDMISIEIDNFFPTTATASVLFSGTKFGGGTVSHLFIVDDNNGQMETFSFAALGFTDLVSLTMNPGAGAHLFDNIIVSPVPEPSTFALALGLISGTVVLIRRRK